MKFRDLKTAILAVKLTSAGPKSSTVDIKTMSLDIESTPVGIKLTPTDVEQVVTNLNVRSEDHSTRHEDMKKGLRSPEVSKRPFVRVLHSQKTGQRAIKT